MILKVTIDMSNAAFHDDPDGELKRILLGVAARASGTGLTAMLLRDSNGNKVGMARIFPPVPANNNIDEMEEA